MSTGVTATSESERGDGIRVELESSLARAVALAVVWTAVIGLRLGTAEPAVLCAALGATALTLGLLLVLGDLSRPLSDGTRAVLIGAWCSGGLLAMLATVLKLKTHHRALGAVTFSIMAAATVLFASAVAHRLLRLSKDSWVPRASLFGGALLSFVMLARAGLDAGGAKATSDLLVDAVCLVTLLGIARVAEGAAKRAPARARRIATLAWLLSVISGSLVFVTSGAARRPLEARARVALGLLGTLGEP